MLKISLIVVLSLWLPKGMLAQHDSIFKTLAFGKGVSTLYAGSGALKRYLDVKTFKTDLEKYYKTPAFSLGVDHCIYPYASNAYLGIGPFISVWVASEEALDEKNRIQRTVSSSLLAIKLSHHASYFVRKKWDVCSGYVFGINLKHEHSYKVNDVSSPSPNKKNEISPAIGITLTVRYYLYHKIGVYAEGGFGYRVNLLNIGLCYKVRRPTR